ncbi:Nitrate transporter [Datura stramonium]|uniref:Nitrate transporter n=1 Tax=Datura stramonium TaxID=4076 RepID=A0ABS8T1H6_DATST|nr:Nitrate transporter [Datura stramonium]
MASSRAIFVATLVICCSLAVCRAEILFSTLKRSIEVSVSHRQGVLMAGEDQLILKWSINKTLSAGTDSTYKSVKLHLCYAPISQKDRAWRKTEDHLKKDKTCQFKIDTLPYKSSGNIYNWTIERDVPTGTYFVRAYILNAENEELGRISEEEEMGVTCEYWKPSWVLFGPCRKKHHDNLSFGDQTLLLNSSPSQGQVLQGGEGQMSITWSLNKSYPTGTDSRQDGGGEVMLCPSEPSGQRMEINNNLKKDKTCQINVVTMPYKPSNNNFTWTIDKEVPTATYFIRAYVYDSAGEVVAIWPNH